jgi:hypothetical protein
VPLLEWLISLEEQTLSTSCKCLSQTKGKGELEQQCHSLLTFEEIMELE